MRKIIIALEIILISITIYVPTLIKNYLFQFNEDINTVDLSHYILTTLVFINFIYYLLYKLSKVVKYNNYEKD